MVMVKGHNQTSSHHARDTKRGIQKSCEEPKDPILVEQAHLTPPCVASGIEEKNALLFLEKALHVVYVCSY